MEEEQRQALTCLINGMWHSYDKSFSARLTTGAMAGLGLVYVGTSNVYGKDNKPTGATHTRYFYIKQAKTPQKDRSSTEEAKKVVKFKVKLKTWYSS